MNSGMNSSNAGPVPSIFRRGTVENEGQKPKLKVERSTKPPGVAMAFVLELFPLRELEL